MPLSLQRNILRARTLCSYSCSLGGYNCAEGFPNHCFTGKSRFFILLNMFSAILQAPLCQRSVQLLSAVTPPIACYYNRETCFLGIPFTGSLFKHSFSKRNDVPSAPGFPAGSPIRRSEQRSTAFSWINFLGNTVSKGIKRGYRTAIASYRNRLFFTCRCLVSLYRLPCRSV